MLDLEGLSYILMAFLSYKSPSLMQVTFLGEFKHIIPKLNFTLRLPLPLH